MHRVVVGFCVAPFATPLAILFVFSLLHLFGVGELGDADFQSLLASVAIFAIFATPIAIGMTVLGAIPAFVLLRRRNRLRLRDFARVGIVLGGLPFLVFFVWVVVRQVWGAVSFFGWDHPDFGLKPTALGLLSDVPQAAWWLGLGVVSGLASAASFWGIAIRGNHPIYPTSGGGIGDDSLHS